MEYQKIIVQWMEFEIPEVLPRHAQVKLPADFITTITGPRRAGKTYFCFQLIKKLLQRKVPKANILYVNFEDEKLLRAESKDLNELLDAFHELSEIDEKQKIYLFLDEIQNVNDWDAWVRRIHDTQKNINIVLTGSSSKMLSKEISTKLRGRTLNTGIYPLSFKEFIGWQGIKYDLKTVSYSKKRFAVKKEFSSFLSRGGYPAIILNEEFGDEILQGYFESMIFRDVIERYNVKEIKKLRVLSGLLFESVTKDISYNKLANKLKSLGYGLSKNTIIEYISYFEDAYLFFQNLKYEYSLTKRLGSIKKVYCIDNGLLNAVSFKFSEDRGKLMENLVFIELQRRNKNVYYHRKKRECDFLVKEKNKIVGAIQVTEELNDENRKREIDGLIEAMDTYNLSKGIILTYDSEDIEQIKDKTIQIKPLWKWLLE